jgi:hypothetical protein
LFQLLLKLLRAYDDDVAMLALEAITSLAAPPHSHRSLTYSRHVTAMHRVSSNCIPLFQIVEAVNWSFPVIAENFLSPDYEITQKHIRLDFDMSQRPKVYGSDASSDLNPAINQSVFAVPNIQTDPRSNAEIIHESWLPHKFKFALMWRIRMQRRMCSLEGRVTILKQQYRAIHLLLCCHPNSSVLSHFFQDKTDLLRDFVFMLRTGPGSSEYYKYEESIPLELRLIACQCLTAIVGSRDTSAVSVMGRFSWLQHDLGVNRGQYMGLLPCILRSSTSFLNALSTSGVEAALAADSTPRGDGLKRSISDDSVYSETPRSKSQSSDAVRDRLLWTECVLILTMALISVSNALPALVENGFIALLLSVVRAVPCLARSNQEVYVTGLITQLLEMSLSAHQLALTVFKDMCGVDALLDRLMGELTLLSTVPEILDEAGGTAAAGTPLPGGRGKRKRRRTDNVSSNSATASVTMVTAPVSTDLSISRSACTGAVKVLIHSILSTFSLYLQEGGDNRQGQILRGPLFASAFAVLFRSSTALTASLMTPSFAVFGEVINNDPSILSHMLSNGLCGSAIDAMMRESKVRVS